MDNHQERLIAGQAAYTPFLLNFYDLFVIKFSNKFFWRCPASKTLNLYNRNLTDKHLEIGVGTGYYLKFCSNVHQHTKIGLVDLNESSLQKTSRELEHKGVQNITSYKSNALDSLPFSDADFTSVGLNYLLHCVPGVIDEKLNTILANLIKSAKKGSSINVFGSTIISNADRHTSISSSVMSFYNKKGIFNNSEDTFALLEKVCKEYGNYEINIIGAVAFFELKLRT